MGYNNFGIFECANQTPDSGEGRSHMIGKHKLDLRKALEIVVYVAQHIHDRHGLLKVLYIADSQHIQEYGRSLYSEAYRAMPYGPVGTTAYDFIKIAAGEKDDENQEIIRCSLIAKGKKYVDALRQPDLTRLSESDIECLEAAIRQCAPLDFSTRTSLTHDAAWAAAGENGWINTDDIARQLPEADTLLDYLHNG